MPKKKSGKELLMAQARTIAREQGVPPALFLALIQQESGWRTDAGSTAGAQGLTQLMPGTARGLGVRDVWDPVQNMRGGARYLRKQLDAFGSPELALSAYNSGPGGAEASGNIENFSETQNYVRNVMALEAQYRGAGPTAPVGAPPTPGMSPDAVPGMTPAGALGPQLPQGFVDLISRVGPQSQMAAEAVQEEQQQQQAQPQPTTGGLPTFEPGDAGPDVQTDGGSPAVGGLNAEFARRFALLQAAVKEAGGDLTIYSGGRSAEKQAGLYQAAVAKYGSESEARKWVAPPGKSNHDTHAGLKYGLGDGAVASDLRGDLAMAHKLAARYGLVFPLSNEAWHIELAGIRNMK